MCVGLAVLLQNRARKRREEVHRREGKRVEGRRRGEVH
jgi:hypothetical protein